MTFRKCQHVDLSYKGNVQTEGTHISLSVLPFQWQKHDSVVETMFHYLESVLNKASDSTFGIMISFY